MNLFYYYNMIKSNKTNYIFKIYINLIKNNRYIY